MVYKITQGIKISVITNFEGIFFKNYKVQHAFTYRIIIDNQGKDSVQLVNRHWEILDALNENYQIDGEGVIGKKPTLKPGETHTYSSGCLLISPFGTMKGYFTMINFTTTKKFKATVPTFRLGASYALN